MIDVVYYFIKTFNPILNSISLIINDCCNFQLGFLKQNKQLYLINIIIRINNYEH